MLVGTKQLYRQAWFKKFWLETPFLDDNVKLKKQNKKKNKKKQKKKKRKTIQNL